MRCRGGVRACEAAEASRRQEAARLRVEEQKAEATRAREAKLKEKMDKQASESGPAAKKAAMRAAYG